jgi:hypothetical protein
MARKDRAPTPPKRPQAPQRRSSPIDPAKAERQRRILYLVAGSGIVALAIVLAIVFLAGGGGDGGERGALEDAGCTLQSFPALPNKADHSDVPTLTTKPNWNSMPPTSGPHYGQWAIWGSYDEPIPLVQTTHNLEHGGVVIHYGPDVPRDEVDALRTWYNETDDPNALIIVPLGSNKDKITLSAWTAPDASTAGTRDRGRGWLASCKTFDEGAFKAFIDEHRYLGPERIPPEQLAPGT